eukprot:3931875-Rhodomonas_salina.3
MAQDRSALGAQHAMAVPWQGSNACYPPTAHLSAPPFSLQTSHIAELVVLLGYESLLLDSA